MSKLLAIISEVAQKMNEVLEDWKMKNIIMFLKETGRRVRKLLPSYFSYLLCSTLSFPLKLAQSIK